MADTSNPTRRDIANYLQYLKDSSANPRAASFAVPVLRKRPIPSPSKFKLTTVVPSEHDVQTSILALLRRHPKVARAIRYNSGSFRIRGAPGQPDRWFKANDCPGHSDLAGVLVGGRAFYFEIKKPGKSSKPGDLQDTFLCEMAFAGALAAEVSSVDQVIQLLEKI